MMIKENSMKMRLKKRLAIILACVCAVYTLCPVSVSRADELEDAQGQSSDLKNELDSINQELLEISLRRRSSYQLQKRMKKHSMRI